MISHFKSVTAFYLRIARAYARWAPFLLLLGAIVFVPLGLIDAIAIHLDLRSIEVENDLQILAIVTAVLALAGTGLIGEVFYSGAVAVALTHPHGGRPPSLREIARRLKYRSLIGVDLLYTLIVSIGTVLFIAPGVAAFVWLGLAGPVVEIEERGIRAAFKRSLRLVRGRFWFVLWVLVPVEIAGDGMAHVASALSHHLLGSSLPAEWFSETVVNIALTPVYAVAAVLLTLDLIAEKDAAAPHREPEAAPA